MLNLILETSTERGLVAIANGSKVLNSSPLEPEFDNASQLLPAVQRTLETIGATTADLQAVTAGVGPGSYTGIRVAVMVAKTLSMVHQIPLIGIPSLYSLVPDHCGEFASLIDAKIGGVYLAMGERTAEGTQYRTKAALVPLSEAIDLLKQVSQLVTPHVLPLQRRLELTQRRYEWQEKGPDPKQMAHLAYEKFCRRDYSTDCSLEILYLRRTQAEIEREARDS